MVSGVLSLFKSGPDCSQSYAATSCVSYSAEFYWCCSSKLSPVKSDPRLDASNFPRPNLYNNAGQVKGSQLWKLEFGVLIETKISRNYLEECLQFAIGKGFLNVNYCKP